MKVVLTATLVALLAIGLFGISNSGSNALAYAMEHGGKILLVQWMQH